MQVRPIEEGDVEQVIQLFRANYGDDYSMPEFYDPQWVKRGIYSDHIIWLVIEDEGKIVASGACILNYGDYNDLIGEIGRVVVDPGTSGHGLGSKIISALVDASDQRVEFAFGEARTVHPKSQKINAVIGLEPLGFLPMHYMMKWRESLVFSGQLFGNGRNLRRVGEAQVIPQVAPLAHLSLRHLQLDEAVTVREDARAYPIDQHINVAPLTATSLLRVLKIESGRLTDTEVFSGMHIDEGIPQLEAHQATYLVATDGERTLGAIGFTYTERHKSVRIIELIAQDDAVKGSLLRLVVDKAEQDYEAAVIECDVSAYSPRIQQTLLEMGFLPTSYVPGMVFHRTARYDIVKFAKLNVLWDLGPVELIDSSREYYDLVAPAFERASAEYQSKMDALNSPALNGFSPLDAHLFQRATEESAPEAGNALGPDAMHIVLAGTVRQGEQTFERGGVINAGALLGTPSESVAVTGPGARVLSLTAANFSALCEKHPRLGIKLYQNLAAIRND